MGDIKSILAAEIAKGLIKTGIEGPFNTAVRSTGGDYPSIGVSCWERTRADYLLNSIPGGSEFIGRSYSDIVNSGALPRLKALLDSEAGRAAQVAQLTQDCLTYVDTLQAVPTLDDTRCLIYAGMWCPTSHYVVSKFLHRRWAMYNLRSLKTLRDIFKTRYWVAADVGSQYAAGYANRAEITYDYVAGIDLTSTYGIPAYGMAGNGY